MPASELQKKAAYFLVFVLVVVAVLILLPDVHSWVRDYFRDHYNLHMNPDGLIEAADKNVAVGPKMVETTFSITINLLHIVRIVVWMALVIAFVRFFSY